MQAIVVIRSSGDLGVRETLEIARLIEALLAQGRTRIVLDWSAVDWIDPLAIGALLKSKAAAEKDDGALKLAGTTPFVRRIFWKYGIDEIFEIYASIDDALTSFDGEWSGYGAIH